MRPRLALSKSKASSRNKHSNSEVGAGKLGSGWQLGRGSCQAYPNRGLSLSIRLLINLHFHIINKF